MSVVNIIILIVCTTIAGAGLLAAVVTAFRGKDLAYFEACKTNAPHHYRSLKGVCRINGPLCILLCGGGLVFFVGGSFSEGGSLLAGLGWGVMFAILLWLSIRWTVWGWKKST